MKLLQKMRRFCKALQIMSENCKHLGNNILEDFEVGIESAKIVI